MAALTEIEEVSLTRQNLGKEKIDFSSEFSKRIKKEVNRILNSSDSESLEETLASSKQYVDLITKRINSPYFKFLQVFFACPGKKALFYRENLPYRTDLSTIELYLYNIGEHFEFDKLVKEDFKICYSESYVQEWIRDIIKIGDFEILKRHYKIKNRELPSTLTEFVKYVENIKGSKWGVRNLSITADLDSMGKVELEGALLKELVALNLLIPPQKSEDLFFTKLTQGFKLNGYDRILFLLEHEETHSLMKDYLRYFRIFATSHGWSLIGKPAGYLLKEFKTFKNQKKSFNNFWLQKQDSAGVTCDPQKVEQWYNDLERYKDVLTLKGAYDKLGVKIPKWDVFMLSLEKYKLRTEIVKTCASDFIEYGSFDKIKRSKLTEGSIFPKAYKRFLDKIKDLKGKEYANWKRHNSKIYVSKNQLKTNIHLSRFLCKMLLSKLACLSKEDFRNEISEEIFSNQNVETERLRFLLSQPETKDIVLNYLEALRLLVISSGTAFLEWPDYKLKLKVSLYTKFAAHSKIINLIFTNFYNSEKKIPDEQLFNVSIGKCGTNSIKSVKTQFITYRRPILQKWEGYFTKLKGFLNAKKFFSEKDIPFPDWRTFILNLERHIKISDWMQKYVELGSFHDVREFFNAKQEDFPSSELTFDKKLSNYMGRYQYKKWRKYNENLIPDSLTKPFGCVNLSVSRLICTVLLESHPFISEKEIISDLLESSCLNLSARFKYLISQSVISKSILQYIQNLRILRILYGESIRKWSLNILQKKLTILVLTESFRSKVMVIADRYPKVKPKEIMVVFPEKEIERVYEYLYEYRNSKDRCRSNRLEQSIGYDEKQIEKWIKDFYKFGTYGKLKAYYGKNNFYIAGTIARFEKLLKIYFGPVKFEDWRSKNYFFNIDHKTNTFYKFNPGVCKLLCREIFSVIPSIPNKRYIETIEHYIKKHQLRRLSFLIKNPETRDQVIEQLIILRNVVEWKGEGVLSYSSGELSDKFSYVRKTYKDNRLAIRLVECGFISKKSVQWFKDFSQSRDFFIFKKRYTKENQEVPNWKKLMGSICKIQLQKRLINENNIARLCRKTINAPFRQSEYLNSILLYLRKSESGRLFQVFPKKQIFNLLKKEFFPFRDFVINKGWGLLNLTNSQLIRDYKVFAELKQALKGFDSAGSEKKSSEYNCKIVSDWVEDIKKYGSVVALQKAYDDAGKKIPDLFTFKWNVQNIDILISKLANDFISHGSFLELKTAFRKKGQPFPETMTEFFNLIKKIKGSNFKKWKRYNTKLELDWENNSLSESNLFAARKLCKIFLSFSPWLEEEVFLSLVNKEILEERADDARFERIRFLLSQPKSNEIVSKYFCKLWCLVKSEGETALTFSDEKFKEKLQALDNRNIIKIERNFSWKNDLTRFKYPIVEKWFMDFKKYGGYYGLRKEYIKRGLHVPAWKDLMISLDKHRELTTWMDLLIRLGDYNSVKDFFIERRIEFPKTELDFKLILKKYLGVRFFTNWVKRNENIATGKLPIINNLRLAKNLCGIILKIPPFISEQEFLAQFENRVEEVDSERFLYLYKKNRGNEVVYSYLKTLRTLVLCYGSKTLEWSQETLRKRICLVNETNQYACQIYCLVDRFPNITTDDILVLFPNLCRKTITNCICERKEQFTLQTKERGDNFANALGYNEALVEKWIDLFYVVGKMGDVIKIYKRVNRTLLNSFKLGKRIGSLRRYLKIYFGEEKFTEWKEYNYNFTIDFKNNQFKKFNAEVARILCNEILSIRFDVSEKDFAKIMEEKIQTHKFLRLLFLLKNNATREITLNYLSNLREVVKLKGEEVGALAKVPLRDSINHAKDYQDVNRSIRNTQEIANGERLAEQWYYDLIKIGDYFKLKKRYEKKGKFLPNWKTFMYYVSEFSKKKKAEKRRNAITRLKERKNNQSIFEKNGDPKICPECGSNNINLINFESICTKCGVCIGEKYGDSTFLMADAKARSTEAKQYVALGNRTDYVGGLGSFIDYEKSKYLRDFNGRLLKPEPQKHFRRIKKSYELFSSIQGSETEYRVLSILSIIAKKINLTKQVRINAAYFYKKILAAEGKFHTNITTLAYCVYEAKKLEKQNAPINIEEIAEAFRGHAHRVTSRLILRRGLDYGHHIKQILKSKNKNKKVNRNSSLNYFERLISNIANKTSLKDRLKMKENSWSVSHYVMQLKRKSFDVYRALPILLSGGRNPFILAGAIIYLADKLLAKEHHHKSILTQKIIAKATNITEYSIRDHYVNFLKPLFAKNLLNSRWVKSRLKEEQIDFIKKCYSKNPYINGREIKIAYPKFEVTVETINRYLCRWRLVDNPSLKNLYKLAYKIAS